MLVGYYDGWKLNGFHKKTTVFPIEGSQPDKIPREMANFIS